MLLKFFTFQNWVYWSMLNYDLAFLAGDAYQDRVNLIANFWHVLYICLYSNCVQGSESLASWQANLLFEPIQFEVNSILLFLFGFFWNLLYLFDYFEMFLFLNYWFQL